MRRFKSRQIRDLSLALLITVAILSAAGIVTALVVPVRDTVLPSGKSWPETGFSSEESGSGESQEETTESEEETEEPTEKDSSEEPTESETEPIEETREIEIPVNLNPTAKNIWIGDSRMVGIANSGIIDPAENVFIAKGAMAFDWFAGRDSYAGGGALPLLRNYLDTGKPYNVIIQMGINDCANNSAGWTTYTVANYIALINSLAASYPNAVFWFISVGRDVGMFGGAHGRLIPPEKINPIASDFNARMKNDCRANYLAVGEAIWHENMAYADGVHYALLTNRWIYHYVLDKIASGTVDEYEPYPEEEASETESGDSSEEESVSGSESASETETESETEEESGSESGVPEESAAGSQGESGSETPAESTEPETEPAVSAPDETE